MTSINNDLQADIDAIGRIPSVPTILEVICRTTGMGFAAVARVTDQKWVTCAVKDEINFGLVPGSELKLETTICHEIRQHLEPVVIDHVEKDELYAHHHTPLMYGFQSYISIPIKLKDGSFFGTLCAIDPRPAKLNNVQTIEMFKLFAELISHQLNSVRELDDTQTELSEERRTSELREQFIAVLGHDLRNPVGAVLNSAQILMQSSLNDRVIRLATIIQDSAYRMIGLIENVLDFARGRMGEGIILTRNADEPIEKILTQVVTEIKAIWPERVIEIQFSLNEAVNCDGKRIAQLFSNLLGNALSYGDPEMPVQIIAASGGSEFILSICNYGNAIPPETREKLFQPFSRGEVKPGKQGLGLGLYIASEIARAHSGILSVESNELKTCFTLITPS